MNAIPEKWYVLYKDREEFNIINNHFKKNWCTLGELGKCGYTNISDNNYNNWVELEGIYTNKIYLEEQKAVEISFEDFTKYIINKEPFISKKQDLNYLKLLLKKLKIK
jgi:hypothetical protein